MSQFILSCVSFVSFLGSLYVFLLIRKETEETKKLHDNICIFNGEVKQMLLALRISISGEMDKMEKQEASK